MVMTIPNMGHCSAARGQSVYAATPMRYELQKIWGAQTQPLRSAQVKGDVIEIERQYAALVRELLDDQVELPAGRRLAKSDVRDMLRQLDCIMGR